MNSDVVKEYILNHTDFKPLNIERIGSGASGAVFKAELENEPYRVAVKCSTNTLSCCRRNMIRFNLSVTEWNVSCRSCIQSAVIIMATALW